MYSLFSSYAFFFLLRSSTFFCILTSLQLGLLSLQHMIQTEDGMFAFVDFFVLPMEQEEDDIWKPQASLMMVLDKDEGQVLHETALYR